MKEAQDMMKDAIPFKVVAAISACLFSFLFIVLLFFSRSHADGRFQCLHEKVWCQSETPV